MNSDDSPRMAVQRRLDSLTKPKGSLGRLEDVVLHYTAIRGEELPPLPRKGMYVLCADHGVCVEGVSPYPSEVTRQMVANFVAGGAAINVLCRHYGIETVVVDCGVKGGAVDGARNEKIAPGTDNFRCGPAMTRAQAEASLALGAKLAREAASRNELVGLGEMGIGNTTSAAALLCALAGVEPEVAVGPGAGLNSDGVRRKVEVVRAALELHRPDPRDGIGVLAAVGGFEIGAMAGFAVEAAALRLPVVMDGFISCSAALVARRLGAANTLLFAHRSAEPGHAWMLEALGARPLLDLGMRLGEGTGAALAMGLIESALRLYREMATFESAGVSGETA